MIRVSRSGVVTARRSGNYIRGLGCGCGATYLSKLFLGLFCLLAGIPSGKLHGRLPRGIEDLHIAMNPPQPTPNLGHCNFEDICDWMWNKTHGFIRTGPSHVSLLAPFTDASNSPDGHFLWLNGSAEGQIWSKSIPQTGSRCLLELALRQIEMKNGTVRLIIETDDTSSVAVERRGNNDAMWQINRFNLGAISQPHRLVLEMVVPYSNSSIAVDNIRLVDCFPESTPIIRTTCTEDMFRCNNGSCLNRTRICDLTADCADGEDETLECDRIPENARCNFESGWCGWSNVPGRPLNWTLHRGPTPTERTGPSYDHTYRNATGTYAYVNMSRRAEYGSRGTIESPLYNPTPPYSNDTKSPYYKSCQVRFFYHQYGVHSGSLGLYQVQVRPHQNYSEALWWSYGDRSNVWYNQAVALPATKYRYFLQFEASKGYASKGDVAIDDFSLSPECFGIGVPPEVVGDFNYYSPVINVERESEQHGDFANETVIRITTCGATGRMGPTAEQCASEYNRTDIELVVPSSDEQSTTTNMTGIQRWTAPQGGYYTLIGMGARGGRGSGGMGSTLGSLVRAIVELEKGQQLYFMVGQPGSDACPKSLGLRMHECQQPIHSGGVASADIASIVRQVKKIKIKDGGGGGGGATYIFKLMDNGEQQPLIIAAGGGGLGLGQFMNDGIQHGKGPPPAGRASTSGTVFSGDAGAGGGWNSSWDTEGNRTSSGMALSRGGIGGRGCGPNNRSHGNGGFGGGGGGCLTGGGGGGYIGGSTGHRESSNGEGGYSYGSSELMHIHFRPAINQGPGEVFIVPAISGCGCDFRCVVLDQYLSETKCLCPPGWHLGNDSRSCIMADETNVAHQTFMILLIGVSIGLLFAFSALCLLLYNRYQHRKALLRRRIVMFRNGTELTTLRTVSDTMMTEFNPNYEFAGNLYSFKDLPQIPRDNITLVKPLGQGAFGEVYQGVYRYGRDEKHPVAVKTLPSVTTTQAEADFMMEALIMSKFNHPNIVHFIGVSFDKNPRYIVLELLAGGDLKNFLREERPRADRTTSLSMQDLVMCAFDVANGCKYMEDARFIHRDIAARNCLLTCKEPGRVVKIADFGMARDIYRSDYYRKGGKAMLPIKWMPPESFLDGIFTTKTDVWAFGVLLWEIMSFGYMPYTGCANREVMSMVTNGGRLERPAGCPDPIYGVMTRCWHPQPEERPSFTTIVERIGYCLQDPDVINHPMPNYDILPACEREITIMRPDPETECINVHADLDGCGYMQPKANFFRPTSYRIGPGAGTGIVYEHDIDIPQTAGPSESIFVRSSEESHEQSECQSRYSDTERRNSSCNYDNDHAETRVILDNDNFNNSQRNRKNVDSNNEELNVYQNTQTDTECSSGSLVDNGNEQVGDVEGSRNRSMPIHDTETAVEADRKNGNESTTTIDTNSDSLIVHTSDTHPDTSSTSSPNTRTCSPSRVAVNAKINSNPNATNVNGMLKKNALKAALSLDPSALCRGTIPYEKIAFSPPPQRTSNPGSMELRRDSVGRELPREEECSC